MHDIDFMIANSDISAAKADIKAIWNSDLSLEGLVMKAGLSLRTLFLPRRFYGGDKKIGLKLKHIVKFSPVYRETYRTLGILPILLRW